MTFKFIDNTTIDGKARKLIRSHAAAGKNVGRKLSRPSRKNISSNRFKTMKDDSVPKLKPTAGHSQAAEVIPYAGDKKKMLVTKIEHQISDEFSFVSFPFDAMPIARSLVRRVLSFVKSPYSPLEVCTMIDFASNTTQFMAEKIFRDEACFYCTAAMSLVALNSRPQEQEAFHLLAFTFRLLNSKLSGADALKDPTIAAVVAMTGYERLRGEYQKGFVHLKGIERMVELRGGISQLTKNQPGLTQKIFRADLELALYIGSATIFHPEDAPGHETISWLRSNFVKTQNYQSLNSELLITLDLSLHEVLSDISSLAWMLNGYLGPEIKLDGYTFHDVLLLFGYRLLHISSLGGPRPSGWLENTLQASLVVFMSSFLTGLGGILPNFPPLSKLARSLAQDFPGGGTDEDEVYLWTLFIGSTSVFSKQDDAWLIPRIQKTMLALDLHDWEDVSQLLTKFPWVHVLHDKPALALWNRLTST